MAAAITQMLAEYDPLDVIGTGSFGVIRKVRRRTDGLTFARKELDFEKMSDNDRRQILAEVFVRPGSVRGPPLAELSLPLPL